MCYVWPLKLFLIDIYVVSYYIVSGNSVTNYNLCDPTFPCNRFKCTLRSTLDFVQNLSLSPPFQSLSKYPPEIPASFKFTDYESESSEILIRRQSQFGRSIKRAGDVIFAIITLSISLPLLCLISILVKQSSSGPIFYIQERVGRNFSRFGCIKFRTMRVDADELLVDILSNSASLRQEFERDFKLREDPRITAIGKLLRRSSLDELPQFINVIRGEMSVVGPRPIVEGELHRYGEFMHEVSSVRPGLTGLWQVSGRNNLSYEQRVKFDLQYVRSRSFLLDLLIIIRTFGVLLFPRDRGAY